MCTKKLMSGVLVSLCAASAMDAYIIKNETAEPLTVTVSDPNAPETKSTISPRGSVEAKVGAAAADANNLVITVSAGATDVLVKGGGWTAEHDAIAKYIKKGNYDKASDKVDFAERTVAGFDKNARSPEGKSLKKMAEEARSNSRDKKEQWDLFITSYLN
jgi:hypothetical protein